MLLLIVFAFLSGLVTILTPCIWPLLPIVLAASTGGKSHKKPLGVTLGILVSFSVLTLLISFLVRLFHFDPNVLRILAVIILVFFGISLLSPSFTAILEIWISRLSGMFGQRLNQRRSDFSGGFITGLSIGVIWTPCAGPILATIATLSALGKVSAVLVGMMIAFVIGVGIPLFIFAYGGQQVVSRTRFISKYTGRIQHVFGIIMILTAIAIYTNYDKVIQANLLNAFPQLSSSLNNFGNSQQVTDQINALKGAQSFSANSSGLFNADTPAPDFTGITKWLNLQSGEPVPSVANLKGKVVLVDFWTYTCINCIRTLPHVTNWYDKYKNDGFVVIGVHTPEFEFEHDTNNVLAAIKMFNIHYPVAQDNNYATWNAYNNEYWPAEYLIDSQGIIRRTEFGEGNYDQTEMAIQELLKEAGQKVQMPLSKVSDQTPQEQTSPETYLGSNRMQYLYPNGSTSNGASEFTTPSSIPVNTFAYGGQWTITGEQAITGKDASITYHFFANKVYLVLKPPSGTFNCPEFPAGSTQTSCIYVNVLLDGKIVSAANAGQDVKNGVVTVDSDRLYNLIDLHDSPGDHVLKLEFQTPGIQAFAFTFG